MQKIPKKLKKIKQLITIKKLLTVKYKLKF